MTETFEIITANVRCKENIYVAADGRTVVSPTDKRVAFLKYGIGSTISPAQHAELVFPSSSDPVPEAEQRSEPIADAETRGSKRKKN